MQPPAEVPSWFCLSKDLGFVLCDRQHHFEVMELWLWGSLGACGGF